MINVEGKTSESLHEAVTVALLLGANDQPGLPFFRSLQIISVTTKSATSI